MQVPSFELYEMRPQLALQLRKTSSDAATSSTLGVLALNAVPTWGSSRVDVGFVFWVRWSRTKDPCGGLHPGSILTPPVFAFLLPGEMAFPARFRGQRSTIGP